MTAVMGVVGVFQSATVRLADDHAAFRESVRDFLDREVAPHYRGWRAARHLPAELFIAAGEYGFLGFGASERFGGAGVEDPRFTAVLVDECNRQGFVGLASILAMHVGVCIPHLGRFGDPQQQALWLPELIAGRAVAAVTDNAVDAGGRALSGGPGTEVATLLMTPAPPTGHVALTDTRIAGTVVHVKDFLGVDEAPGVEVTVTDDRPRDDTPGVREFVSAVDAWAAVVHAGASRYALELAVQYAGARKVFGRPLASFENTRSVVGAAVANTIAVSDLAHAAAIPAGERDPARAAAARLVAAAAHRHNTDVGLQIHGGYGYMREYPIAQCYADAAALTTTSLSGGRIEQLLTEHVGL
ncbi:acyl-CoA dehydrogenase family protein [Mycobacterium sherrisii]|uniref:acyl-CoA dehydrogenase family protein n=1 Tax=Mycobacterium sherrisii TaxID=243061 RepID=UPI000A160557|nr:acyl-CoA dehydrogenase family protein [Mycobacterium sherrisii]MCV7032523.1 acyl-CoA dehydrogenase family protein [Mycobacterium sherrisii]ORW74183.1 hypothetical protein AWC25_00375 [Mycobacterium sherrisii]